MARTWLSKTNGAAGTLNAVIDDVQSTATLHTGEGLAFPSSNFYVTIGSEIILVSSKAGDTFTIIRGKEGTARSIHAEDSPVELRVITKYFDDVEDAIDDIDVTNAAHIADTDAHGATGAVVGTTKTQTLTNKTLTSPVINTPTGITKTDVGLANVDNTSDATKQAATVAAVLGTIYPIGSLYTSTLATNPGTLLGIGTWIAFGVGQVMVGAGTGYTAGATGGATTVTLSEAQMPSHRHNTGYHYSGQEAGGYGATITGGFQNRLIVTGPVDNATLYTGESQPHSNMQPYINVYMWKRTA